MKHFLSRSPFHRSEKQQDNVCLPPPSSLPPPRAPSPPPSYNTATPIAPHTGSSAPPLTVVELFQSQGCSSCPPANANVLALAAAPDTLVLTYEVTYWDYLGWPDTFARKEWDVRQREYASAMKSNRVYTPQVRVVAYIEMLDAHGVEVGHRKWQRVRRRLAPKGAPLSHQPRPKRCPTSPHHHSIS